MFETRKFMKKTSYQNWLETFLMEKGIDLEELIEVDGEIFGKNFIPVGCVVKAILQAPANEKEKIKEIIVKIDFCNGDVMHFFRHLAKGLAI